MFCTKSIYIFPLFASKDGGLGKNSAGIPAEDFNRGRLPPESAATPWLVQHMDARVPRIIFVTGRPVISDESVALCCCM